MGARSPGKIDGDLVVLVQRGCGLAVVAVVGPRCREPVGDAVGQVLVSDTYFSSVQGKPPVVEEGADIHRSPHCPSAEIDRSSCWETTVRRPRLTGSMWEQTVRPDRDQ